MGDLTGQVNPFRCTGHAFTLFRLIQGREYRPLSPPHACLNHNLIHALNKSILSFAGGGFRTVLRRILNSVSALPESWIFAEQPTQSLDGKFRLSIEVKETINLLLHIRELSPDITLQGISSRYGSK